MATKLAFLHALSSLHPGAGQGVGAIDLPVMRERASNLPIVPGSSIKGCLRDAFHAASDADEETLFGPARGAGADFAGALRIGDARLLLLPVRSLACGFVWVTSPYALLRFRRDLEAAGVTGAPQIPTVADGNAFLAADDALLTLGQNRGKRLVLEEYDFQKAEGNAGLQWCDWISRRLFGPDDPWCALMRARFAIIDDASFFHLAEYATEVQAHIAIDDKTGTVETGALWYQETLPAETVLVSLLQADRPFNGSNLSAAQVVAKLTARSDVQFGGKAGAGQGRVRFVPFGA